MKVVTISTSQNVPIEYELAKVRDRIFASLIDAMIFYFAYWLFFVIILANTRFTENSFGVIFIVYFSVAAFMFYQVICDFLAGGTLGKKAIGIKVVRLDGQEMSLGDHALRAIFYLIDCFLTIGFLAIVMVMSTERAQRFGDMAANTTVIKRRASNSFSLGDILSISTLNNYEPIYPQVVNLKEEDLILVKTILNRSRIYNNASHQVAVRNCVEKMQEVLDIKHFLGDYFSFLNTILKDYIVLTR